MWITSTASFLAYSIFYSNDAEFGAWTIVNSALCPEGWWLAWWYRMPHRLSNNTTLSRVVGAERDCVIVWPRISEKGRPLYTKTMAYSVWYIVRSMLIVYGQVRAFILLGCEESIKLIILIPAGQIKFTNASIIKGWHASDNETGSSPWSNEITSGSQFFAC